MAWNYSRSPDRAGLLLALVAAANVDLTTHAATIRVPADQPSIQAGINAATNGDTVLVSPGTYFENIDFLGKAITVVSQSGPVSTIIDGQQLASVVTFTNGEDRTSVLQGFTIRNGGTGPNPINPLPGGGVRMERTSPSIIGNIISNNLAGAGCGI